MMHDNDRQITKLFATTTGWVDMNLHFQQIQQAHLMMIML